MSNIPKHRWVNRRQSSPHLSERQHHPAPANTHRHTGSMLKPSRLDSIPEALTGRAWGWEVILHL